MSDMPNEDNQAQDCQSSIVVPDTQPAEAVEAADRSRRPLEGPIARFRNAVAPALTDQVNGMILVMEDEHERAESPHGTYVFDNCVKEQGSLTTQANGLLVGVRKGAPRGALPAHPGIHGLWNRCSTVESVSPPAQESDEDLLAGEAIDLSPGLNVNANHTIQLNGGIVTTMVGNRLIIPKISQS